MFGLWAALREHWGPLEADFHRYYELDLSEALWGPHRLSTRYLAVRVGALPEDSAFARAVSPTPGWRTVDELLAQVIEATTETNRLLHHAHFEKPHPRGFRFPRPGRETAVPKPRMSTAAEIRAFAGGSVRYRSKESE
jgi:hypothetical protein